jgi:quercetin dioxygenase-like cupin family protein
MTRKTPGKDARKTPADTWEGIDLPQNLKDLKAGKAWTEVDSAAKVLFQGSGMRVVLVALHGGKVIAAQQAPCAMSVLVLEGRLRFETEGGSTSHQRGQLLTVEPGIRHEIEALADAAFLVTLAQDRPYPS